MQYLKDDVKDKIKSAALREFSEKGYRDASMRVIAKNAGIVMGNIYRYFENKEALFNSLVGPVYDQIEGMSQKIDAEIESRKGPWTDDEALTLIHRLYHYILVTFSGYGIEILILLDKSAGSVYENSKKELIDQIEHVLRHRLLAEASINDVFIFYVVATAFVEGICVVLRDTQGHDKEATIGLLSNIMLCQISKRI